MKRKMVLISIIFFLIIINILNPISLSLDIKKITINKEISIEGNTLYVGGTGPNNYSKIKDAINDALIGDTIFVYNGIYYERIILYKSLNIIGENKEKTIVDCLDKTDVIKISADNVTIKNLTLCDAGQNFLYTTDAGIEISDNKNNITIENNIITKGYCGVLTQNSDNVSIKNNIFHTNNGPNIWISGEGEKNSIIGNKITRKINEKGGGIWLETCSAKTIIKNNIFTNSGIFIFGNTIDHFTHEIQGNVVNNKSLFYVINQNNLHIPIDAVNLILVNCSNILINEINASNVETGVLLAFCSNVTIKNSDFSYSNGGITLINITNCKITNNTITDVGDAITIKYSYKNIINNNTIFRANRLGIEVVNSDNNSIIKNTVSTNFSTRNIELINSYNNKIYHNNFLVYNKDSSYPYYIAVDTGVNQWDDGDLGNYWWDYEEKYLDTDDNGVTYYGAYEILPDYNKDNKPLVKPIGIISNPPMKPIIIRGKIYGGKNVNYEFNTTTLEPDGDELYYLFDWGDGTKNGWIGPYNSEDVVSVNKTWEKIGFYKIKVKSKDVYGFESQWSDSIRIIIPKTQHIIKFEFLRFLNNFFNFYNK